MWTANTLVFVCIWSQQNDVVFNWVVASQIKIKEKIKEEHGIWRFAK
jgi:hypothetical protein